MNIGMAIQAPASQRIGASARASQGGGVAAMAGWLVALLTQEWRPRLEQVGCGGAVRVVADRAIFRDRLMGSHERATFFHVAGVAGVIYAIPHH